VGFIVRPGRGWAGFCRIAIFVNPSVNTSVLYAGGFGMFVSDCRFFGNTVDIGSGTLLFVPFQVENCVFSENFFCLTDVANLSECSIAGWQTFAAH
jgi:hypothetical protein